MTDDEIKAAYRKVDPRGDGDESWWADAIRVARRAIEAPSYGEAVAILTWARWGDPAGAARDLRQHALGVELRTCSTCHGLGFTEEGR